MRETSGPPFASRATHRFPDETSFDRLALRILEHLFDFQPGYAVFLGLHEYDGRLPNLSTAYTDRWLVRTEEFLRSVREVDASTLPQDQRIDPILLRLLLEGTIFDLRDVETLEKNPMAFLGAPSLTSYMVRDYAPVADRTRAIVSALEGVPALLEVGRHRLGEHLPKPFLDLAVTIGSGLPSHFADAEAFARRDSASGGDAVARARGPAEAAIAEFVGRIRSHWLPKATDDFALGPARYQRLLWVREGIERPFGEIESEGLMDLRANQSRLAELAGGATSEAIDALLEGLYKDHPEAADLVPTAHEFVAETRRFVVDHELVTIPSPDLCQVEETPSFGRALSTASMNPPGPFEVGGDVGIYFVTPVDPDWSPTKAEEWLRSLNRPMLRNITFHEVYPGHYLQFLHHRRTAASSTRKSFLSNAFTEGWAHYCEELAIEAGLRADRSAEAAQLHDALLRDCRLLASVGLHTQGWSLERATRLFETEAHMERLPAEREAIRGTFDPEYFCYTLGKLTIRAAREKHLGPRFGGSLQRFHDRLLSFGAPPVGLIDRLLSE